MTRKHPSNPVYRIALMAIGFILVWMIPSHVIRWWVLVPFHEWGHLIGAALTGGGGFQLGWNVVMVGGGNSTVIGLAGAGGELVIPLVTGWLLVWRRRAPWLVGILASVVLTSVAMGVSSVSMLDWSGVSQGGRAFAASWGRALQILAGLGAVAMLLIGALRELITAGYTIETKGSTSSIAPSKVLRKLIR